MTFERIENFPDYLKRKNQTQIQLLAAKLHP